MSKMKMFKLTSTSLIGWKGELQVLQIYITWSGLRVPVIRGSTATIFVDEMRTDPSFLNILSVHDIGMIKVIKGPFAGAIGNGGGGTIAIYTIKRRGGRRRLD